MTDDFARRMREKRERADEEREARERSARLESGAAVAAYHRTYAAIVAAFGAPAHEAREGARHILVWDDALAIDLGVVYSAILRPTAKLAIVELLRRASELIAAPRTEVSMVIAAPPDHYAALEPLERWAQQHNHLPTRVFNDPKLDRVFVFLRSNGPVDWFGNVTTKARSVVQIEIP